MSTDTEGRRPLQFFPVAIGRYEHHDQLNTAVEVEAVAELLAPFGAETYPWEVPEEARGSGAVEDRMLDWGRPSTSGDTFLYWLGHGESDGQSARLAHARSPRPLTAGGINPEEFIQYVALRQADRLAHGTWSIVVVDTCRSARFVELMSAQAFADAAGGPRNVLMVGTSDEGIANLGRFRKALSTALEVNFRAEDTIDLWALAKELARNLPGCPVIPHHIDPDAALHREMPALAGAVTASLDILAEIETVLAGFTDDERRHFIPKASGAEFGEQVWYFEGRTTERNRLLSWLDSARGGLAVVTGMSGAGKSALLGHVLVHTRPQLSTLLERAGHLDPLPPDIPCPLDPFDAVIHLTGATPQDVVSRIAEAAGLPDPPADPSLTTLTDWLYRHMEIRNAPFTVLADGLDEGHLPVVSAQRILRRLARLPRVRVVVGTRRSTDEGPDLPRPENEDLLEALGETDLLIDLPRERAAVIRYVRRRLTVAARRHFDAGFPKYIEQIAAAIGYRDREFLYARLAVHEILRDPALFTAEDVERVLDDLLDGDHRQLFARAVERLIAQAALNGPLLEALALAQGRGLPLRDGIWAAAATAIAGGPTVTDEHIDELTRVAAPYLMLDTEFGQSVYRLAHRTFAEHFRASSPPDQRHHLVATRLTTDVDSRLPDHEPNPYVRHYVPAHVALGGTAAWEGLASRPRVLDRLDPTAVTTNVMLYAFGRSTLPPAIAAVLGARNLLATAEPHDRAGIRELAGARYTDMSERVVPQSSAPDPVAAWTVKWARLPRHAVHLKLIGHSRGVAAVSVFTGPDGRVRLVSGGGDGMVRVWDADGGTQLAAWPAQVEWVGAVAAYTAAGGGARVATGGDFGDGAVRIWDPTDGTELAVWPGHRGSVGAVRAFTGEDGRLRLVTGGGDGVLRIRDPDSGEVIAEWTGHTGSVWEVATFEIAGEGIRLISGSGDHTARIWDAQTGAQLAVLRGHSDSVWAVTPFTGEDGRLRVATGGTDGQVRTWDAATGAALAAWNCHDDGVWAVEALTGQDGAVRLATGGDDGTVRIWDPQSGTEVGVLTGHKKQSLGSFAAFRSTGGGRMRLATGGTDETIRIWDVDGDTKRATPIDDITDVAAVALFRGPDGRMRLVTGGADGAVRIWDAEHGAELCAWHGHDGGVRAVDACTRVDGCIWIVTGGADGAVRIWNPNGGAQLVALTGHSDAVTAVAAVVGSDDGVLLVTRGADGTARVWDVQEGVELAEWGGRGAGPVAAVIGKNGEVRLAVGGADGVVRIWDPDSGSQVSMLTRHIGEVAAVTYFTGTGDRPRLATGGVDGTVHVWDAEDGVQLATLTGHVGGVRVVTAFTGTDGRARLVVGDDGTVRVWDPDAGYIELTIPVEASVRDLAVRGEDLSIVTSEGIVHISLVSNNYGGSPRKGYEADREDA